MPATGILIAKVILEADQVSDNQIVLVVVIVGVCALLLISTRRRLREARNSPKTYAREQVARLRDERVVVQDMEELVTQLEQIAQQVNARIETKFAKLEGATRAADDRIERLERLLRQAQGQATLDVTVADQATAEPADPADPRRQLIFQLADTGHTPVQIAEEVGQSTGEIELILALRKVQAGVT